MREHPNVVLFVYDSVRPDYLGCYNPQRDTPGVDKLAGESVLFEKTVSASAWTLPAVSSIVSGVYSHRLGLYKWDQAWPDDYQNLFEYFRNAGYRVGSFVFEPQFLFSSVPAAGVIDHSRDPEKMFKWVREAAGEKFFLLVHSHRTHIPWVPQSSSESWRVEIRRLQKRLRENGEAGAEECRGLYADSIRAMSEEEIPGFREALAEKGIEDDTIVVFTSDHGESFCERIEERETITDNFALHGRFLYDECILTPLLFRVPGKGWGGRRIGSQVRSVDIAPTLLDLCGINYDAGSMDGLSLTKVIGGGETANRPAISSTTDTEKTKHLTVLAKLSMRVPPRKLIWSMLAKNWELFDLNDDPSETRNLFESMGAESDVKQMVVALEREAGRIKAFEGDEEEERKLREQLRGLGYL